MSRIFVTGGAGFIGSYIVEQLANQGHEVAIYDSFMHYVFPINEKHFDNITLRLKPVIDCVKVYRGSTADHDYLRRSLNEFRPERVIHLAAMPLSKMASDHPEEAAEAIVSGTLNLLESVRDIPDFKRFLYVSSSMVYGDFEHCPIGEDDLKEPTEIYGSLKFSGELLTKAFGRSSGLPFTIVRPSAVYGPKDNNRRVLNIFLENALSGAPLIVQGKDQALDFTFVSDTANGIIRACMEEKGLGKIYNITRGQGRTILEAAKIIEELVPNTKIEIVEKDKMMPSRGTLDISRARKDIGFEPKVSLEAGLQIYLEYLKAQKNRLHGKIGG